MTLGPEHFAGFFEEVHDHKPFKWQEQLLKRVVASGWPRRLDLPTAAGKSAVIDVAVFALALKGAGGAPRRMFFVIDRRIVVDTVAERAKRIAEAVTKPRTDQPISAEVGVRLGCLGGE